MRRVLARISMLGALGAGCVTVVRPPSPPSPAPETAPPEVVQVRGGPTREVRPLPAPAFADPAKRQQKITTALPEVREVVARIVADEGLVGLAIGVVADGELVLGEGFGALQIEQGGGVDTRTAFRIGSITKVFTGMTVLRLWEEGQLDLDAPAALHLPELGTLVYPSADAPLVTVRDILTHTAGLPRDPDLPILPPGQVYSRDQLMQAIDGLSLVRAPGVAYEYSNLGFALLGHLIARTTGKRFGDAIRDSIIVPLGMTRTVWHPEDTPPERLSIGHIIVDGKVLVRPPGGHTALSAAGGLFSTVEDLARFLAFQLDAWPPRGGDENGPLTRATSREAQRLQAFRSFRVRTAPTELADTGVEGGTSGVGLVWGVSHGCEHSHTVGHNGALDGYRATVRILPHAGIGIIVLANAGWADSDHITAEIQRVLARAGALARRAPQAVPELAEAAARVFELFPQWDESSFAPHTTHRLAAAGNAARLGERMRWLHAALGACTPLALKQATSAFAGVFTADCEKGRAELALTLTSAKTPKISDLTFKWIDGTATPAVQDAAVAAAALLEQFDEAKFHAVFSPAYNLAAIERLVTMVRFEMGSCQLDRALAVESPEEATFSLVCERGKARMSLALDRGQPARIVSLEVVPSFAPVCR